MLPKNKIILFYPKIYEGFVKWHRAPLSLMAVARMVEKEFDVEIIDERVDKKPKEKVADIIQECLCFGITALTGSQIKYALGMAKFVKENAPSIPIVWGGWHPSVVPEQTAMHPLVDIVVRGQGEFSFRELVKALSFNKPLADIPGITYKENNTIVSTPDRPFCDVNEFPPMPYHLVNVENYIGSPPSSDGARIISYISSQGCPHRCAFCSDSRVYKRKWSGLRAERVVDELEKLSKTYNIEGFFFEDSNFFGSLERVRAICKEITKRKLAIKWEAEVRTEKFVRADKELKDMIKESGCYQLLVGAESGSQEVLNLINKDASVDDTVNLVKQAMEYSIVPVLSLMVGLPGVKDDINATIKLIRDSKLYYQRTRVFMFFYTPYPGTQLYETALKYGLKAPSTLDGWADYTLDKIQTPWLKKKNKNLLSNLMFYFTMAYPSEDSMRGTPLTRLAKKLISFLARQRLRLNFYGLPLEAFVVNKYLKRKSSKGAA